MLEHAQHCGSLGNTGHRNFTNLPLPHLLLGGGLIHNSIYRHGIVGGGHVHNTRGREVSTYIAGVRGQSHRVTGSVEGGYHVIRGGGALWGLLLMDI